jgi:mersacidin/lichenicidin family type 2 lantibiotic
MSRQDIIRAWKDEEYRESLSEAERARLPEHLARLIETRAALGATLMDPLRFDSWTRGFTHADSRRAIIRGMLALTASAGALVATGAGHEAAAAPCGGTKSKCRNDSDCCSNRCKRRHGKPTGKCAPAPGPQSCFDFGTLGSGPIPVGLNGLTFDVFDFAGIATPPTVRTDAGFTGLNCGYTLRITFPIDAAKVTLDLVHFAQPATATAFPGGQFAAMGGPQQVSETLTLTAPPGIRVVEVNAPQNETLLLAYCYTPL